MFSSFIKKRCSVGTPYDHFSETILKTSHTCFHGDDSSKYLEGIKSTLQPLYNTARYNCFGYNTVQRWIPKMYRLY